MLNLLVFLLLLVLKEKSTLLSLKTASQPKAAVYLRPLNGSVAQLDRASDYGSEGLGFESLRDRDNSIRGYYPNHTNTTNTSTAQCNSTNLIKLS